MLQKHTNAKNHRFAWLKPVGLHNYDNGPWVLVENQTQRYQPEQCPGSVKVTINGMLDRIASALPQGIMGGAPGEEQSWSSDCERFQIRWHRQKNDNSRLFVQQRSDYFARIELLIDGLIVLAYQEPVWPHLQQSSNTIVDRFFVPADCIDILDAYANANLKRNNDALSGISANETNIGEEESFDDTAAA